jgi:hypothetical protein
MFNPQTIALIGASDKEGAGVEIQGQVLPKETADHRTKTAQRGRKSNVPGFRVIALFPPGAIMVYWSLKIQPFPSKNYGFPLFQLLACPGYSFC